MSTPSSTSNGAGHAGGGGSNWHASYPLPAVSEPAVAPYTFSSPPLEALVYMHPSMAGGPQAFYTSSPVLSQADNSVLRWSGASVLQTLAAILLSSLYPDLKEGALADLRAALTAGRLHAHLARALSLHHRVPNPHAPDRVLADIFEAYIGGIQRDLGTEKFGDLYTWYFRLIEPYAVTYQGYYSSYLSTRPSIPSTPAPPHPTAHAPSTYASGALQLDADAKTRRQNVAGYTSRLMEYAAKNKLTPPVYEFRDNGVQGAGIQWTATVSLGGQEVARAVAGTKIEAKHLCSFEALQALRAPLVGTPPGMGKERRERKEKKRRGVGRGAMPVNSVPLGGGGMNGMQGGQVYGPVAPNGVGGYGGIPPPPGMGMGMGLGMGMALAPGTGPTPGHG